MTSAVRWLSIVFFLASVHTAIAAPPTTTQMDSARAKGLAWLYTNQKPDGSWQTVSGLKLQPTALAMDALANAGLKYAYPYASAQAWLANVPTSSNDSLARQVIALAHSGENVNTLTQRLITQRNANSLGWGAYAKYQAGFPDTGLAMDAILASNLSYADTGYGIGFITSKQNVDGGWSNSATEPNTAASHLIPAAQNVLTLSRYKPVGWNVDSNITNGVNFLLSKQKTDGGFAEDTSATTSNGYDTALVYQALNQAKLAGNAAAIGAQTTLDNALNYLIATQGVDGSWGGDALSTALALQTLPAAVLTDSKMQGIPDVVAAILNNPSARTLAKGNGQSVLGVTIPVILTTTYLNQAFLPFNLTPVGTPPFVWAITAGILPPGLTLSSGVISGIPTAIGNYNFAYSVTDSLGVTNGTIGQIDVITPVDGDLNGDGVVDVADVALAERIALGLITPTANQLLHGDVAPVGAPDGVIDAADVARIRRKALGLETF